jgi:hypothetical protein
MLDYDLNKNNRRKYFIHEKQNIDAFISFSSYTSLLTGEKSERRHR